MKADHVPMGQSFHVEESPTASDGAVHGTIIPGSTNRVAGDSQDRALAASFMDELDAMRAAIADFPNQDPSDILATIAGTAGRLAEIRAQLYRSNSQRCTALRTREVDPLREDLDLQFRVWSRKIALLEWELKMSTGGV